MIAVDTNIIVRFLTHDDIEQYKKAFVLFNTKDIFISTTVILEAEWVLRFAYKFRPVHICQAFINLLGLNNVHFTDKNAVALHLTQLPHCEKLYTFDKRFITKAKNVISCPVVKP